MSKKILEFIDDLKECVPFFEKEISLPDLLGAQLSHYSEKNKDKKLLIDFVNSILLNKQKQQVSVTFGVHIAGDIREVFEFFGCCYIKTKSELNIKVGDLIVPQENSILLVFDEERNVNGLITPFDRNLNNFTPSLIFDYFSFNDFISVERGQAIHKLSTEINNILETHVIGNNEIREQLLDLGIDNPISLKDIADRLNIST